MNLSIIIVNWNTRDLLRDCLASVLQYPPAGTYEIIVVDNDSHDRSADMVAAEFPQVQLIRSDKNLGFGKANNLAAQASTGQQILLLNPDTLVHENTFATTRAYLAQHPQCGVVGVKQLETDGFIQSSCGHFPSLSVMFKQQFLGLLCTIGLASVVPTIARAWNFQLTPIKKLRRFWDFDQTASVGWVMGAYMLMPREVVEKTGLFDERFVVYGEDLDLCQRIHHLGYDVVYLGAASITHFGGASTKEMSARADAAHFVASIILYEKHHGKAAQRIYRTVLACGFVAQFVIKQAKAILKSDAAAQKHARDTLQLKLNAVLRPTFKGLVGS